MESLLLKIIDYIFRRLKMDGELDYKMKFLYTNDYTSNKDNNGLELSILHYVYGEDIDIAVDVEYVIKKLGILSIQKDKLNTQSHLYFCKKRNIFVMEYKKTLDFKKSYVFALNIAYIFLYLLPKKKKSIEIPFLLNHNHIEHRCMNNIHTIHLKEIELFAGKLLVPKGALENIFNKAPSGSRYVVSDLCKVFNVSNDLMHKMLNEYKMWNFKKIYDNLSISQ
jgi:hypothetical protein